MHWLVRKDAYQWLALALGLLFLASSIDDVDGKRKEKKAKHSAQAELKILVDPILRFGTKLMRTMGAEKNNTVFSPVSLHSALGLALLGAESGNETEKELLLALGYGPCEIEANKLFEAYAKLMVIVKKTVNNSKNNKKKSADKSEVPEPKVDIFTMAIANNLMGPPKLNYSKTIDQYFRSSFKIVHDGKPKEMINLTNGINKWANEAGFKEMIKEDELKDNQALMLLSAVRVEAFWFDNFMLDKKKDLFLNHGQQLVEGTRLYQNNIQGNYVDFRTRAKSYGIETSESFKELAPFNFYAADIQLKGGVSFATFMPVERGASSLGHLEEKLLASDENGMLTLCKTFQVLDGSHAKVNFNLFSLPQFRIDANSGPSIEHLKSMGIKRAFDETEADFPKMHSSHLHVGKILHKAMIELNTIGVMATGFTKVVMHPANDSLRWVNLKLDRPFLFVVRYNRVPMLLGHLVNI